MSSTSKVECWDIFELRLQGPAGGNPFLDVSLQASFTCVNRTVVADGFYDGAGTYVVRFMPDTPGRWTFVTRSNRADLHEKSGEFTCTPATGQNHGPVRVHNTFHFAHADGTPHYSFGTTCYAWTHQPVELQQQTLQTLKASPFNKIRMCVFPKDYTYSKNEPEHHPFERHPDGSWNFDRFNPVFFQKFEQRVADLRDINIEADIILFHPYDRWGYAKMAAAVDDRYLRYIVARLSAYRNVWWSLANEFDLMKEKTEADWDRFFRIIQSSDPAQHLRSIHNWYSPNRPYIFYDHAKPWVTHQSIQHWHTQDTPKFRELYRKPVVIDECSYEGNVEDHWGNISALEMVHRTWAAVARGGYVGHGETYQHPQDILWWSKGGTLHGESPARIAFLRQIVEAAPPGGLEPDRNINWDPPAGVKHDFFLFYFGAHQPASKTLNLPDNLKYSADVIDIWEMSITTIAGTFSGKCKVPLPGRPYLALRLRVIKSSCISIASKV
jgi:hypothetical protein